MNNLKPNKTYIIMSLALGFTLTIQGHALAMDQKSKVDLPPEMAYVPYGLKIMGIDKDPESSKTQPKESPTLYKKRMSMPWSKAAFHDEGPAHWVLLDSYLIDKYEVSNKKYETFMRATQHPAPAYWDDPRLNKPHQPVVGVNYFDAKAFCEYEGKRLPTEAEWEHAARGPEGFMYPWGNEFDPTRANFGRKKQGTEPVDSRPEGVSPYGVYNMSGNVFEWVSDWYDPNYYQKAPHQPNPKGPEKAVWLGGTGTYVDRLTTGEKRVIRGGSWTAAENSITATHRFWNHPSNNSYGVGLGFRCAMTTPKSVGEYIKTATVEAMKSMGREEYNKAAHYIQSGLDIDPTNRDLLRLQEVNNKSL